MTKSFSDLRCSNRARRIFAVSSMGQSDSSTISVEDEQITVGFRGYAYRFRTSGSTRSGVASSGTGGDVIVAPMPGVVLHLGATVGSSVRAGEVLVVLESMKMEFPLRSPRDGVVAEVAVLEGDHVGLDEPVARLEALEETEPAPAEPQGGHT